jgi:cysteine-rich repeat protein
VSVDVCTNNCKWTPSSTPEVACSYLSKCGNGTVETGEQCDDGKLNGRYNHCSKTCTWPPNDPPGYCGDGQVQTGSEVCDIKAKLNNKDGVCIYGLSIGLPCDRDFDCKQPGLGVTSYVAGSCALVENTKVRYGTEKADSCNWDCQSFGPYCGDGVVQPEFGEQCDGSQSCSVSSINGTKYCGADCRWSDKSPVGWWRLDDAVVSTQPPRIGIPFAAKKLSFPDAMNKTPGTCSDVACPGFEKQGKILGSFNFNGNNAITIPHTEDLMPYTALSVEAWIKPSTPLSNWSRVLEKGGYTFGGGYGFQFDPSFKQGFVVWGSDTQKPSLEVYSKNALKENEWTHLVGVYNRQGSNHSLKLYINGALDNTATVVSSTAIMGHSTRDLIIGQASGGQDSFKGLIDEIKIYNRVLSLAEISERYNTGWPCSVSTTVSIAVAGAPICGDGKVDAGEACDRGADNGLSCTPNYGGKCTYCSNDCRNVIDVQSQQYCGDGIVNAPVESCDTDPNTKLIYSSSPNFGTQAVKNIDHQGFQVISCSDESQETATFKKGNKICANRCSVVQSNCTVCGETAEDDKNGVSIRGGVVNVINPLSADPISVFTERDDSGKAAFDLTLSDEFDNKVVGKAYWLGDSSPSYYLKTADSSGFSPTRPVKVNSDPRCSFADQPNYKMFINSDNSHGFDFPITLNAPIWQYDLILSPVIDQTKRPSDVRIVASWVNQADFNSQFIVPSIGIPKLATTSTGDDYYFKPSVNGIWKHGFGDSGYKTKLRSFTVDAAQMIDDEYMFFVHLPQAKPTDPGIYQYKDVAHLKVDVYLPENDSNVSHFARPSFTFYLTNAIRSDNSSAPYWHVFNIQKNASGLDRILPVNKIMTRF